MKREVNLLLFVSFLIILLQFSSAQNIIGVSPADVKFMNVLRDGYAERNILVSLTSEEKVKMSVEPMGEISEWLNFSEREFYVSKDTPWRVKIKVNPPSDVPNGNYTGIVRVSSESLPNNGVSGKAVGAIQAVIDVLVSVQIVDQEAFACQASGFEVRTIEEGNDIPFSVNILNQGNIRMKPKLEVRIWDKDQIRIVKNEEYSASESILPTTSQKITFEVSSKDLDIDQYWVDFISLDCSDSETLTFDILEEGALRADGIVTSLISKTWAEIDETLPIIASFKNIGEKDVDAQFRGKITKDDKIVNVLESEKADVSVSDQTNFTFYFTPQESGKYIISGRVFYDKKRTFEASTIVNVKPNVLTFGKILIYLAYLILLILVLFLLYKIRKERVSYFDKLRRLRL